MGIKNIFKTHFKLLGSLFGFSLPGIDCDSRTMGRQGRKIEFYEVQTLEKGQKSENASIECNKRESHKNYINIWEISKQLPFDDPDLSEFITIMCRLTAMIQLSVGDCNRCGSSFVQKVEIVTDKPLFTCGKCEEGSEEMQWGKITLTTAFHVLADEGDATNCEVRFFYDSDDNGDQEKVIQGQKSHSRDEKGDWCALVCVTHDLELLKYLDNMLQRYWTLGHALKERYSNSDCNVVIVVSHPHGGPKRVSVGKWKVKDKNREVREEQDWCTYSYDAVTCAGSSGGPVYVLGRWIDGFGYWFGHSHNHSGIDNFGDNSSTVGVDSTYGQFVKPYSYIDLKKNATTSVNTTINDSNVCDANNNVHSTTYTKH